MAFGPIKRLGQWARVGLLLLPLIALAASPADSPKPEQAPFVVTLHKQIADDQVHYQLLVHADPAQVDIANTTVVAHSRSSAGFSAVRTLSLSTDDQWHWRLSPDEPARYRIDVEVSGLDPEGESFRMALDSHYFQFPEPGDPYISPEQRALAALEQGLEEDLEPAPLHEPPPIKASEKPPVSAEAPSVPNAVDTVNRVLKYGSILTASLVALALLAFGYQRRAARRRIERFKAEQETEKLEPSNSSSPSMQDIGAEDDGELDMDDAEPAVDTARADAALTLDAELPLVPEVFPTDADEALFPLDNDDWASAEIMDSATETPLGSPTTRPNPSQSPDPENNQ